MPEKLLGVPFAFPDDATGGTTPEDAQIILASKYEVHPRFGGGTTRAGIFSGCQVEKRPNTTVRVKTGMVVLQTADHAVVETAVTETDIEVGLTTGEAGTVTVYVAPPARGSNNAIVGTTTSKSIQPGWVVLDRLVFNAGWTTTNNATTQWDREYATLRDTTRGLLLWRRDNDTAARHSRNGRYRAMSGSFWLDKDAAIDIRLSTTIRACNAQGSAAADERGSVQYDLWIDGSRYLTWERMADFFALTTTWGATFELPAGRHEVYVESRRGVLLGSGGGYWQIHQATHHMGDILRIHELGVRR